MSENYTNIDSAEQKKFDRIAATWWDPDGESRPLHDLNPARLAYVAERSVLDGKTVIDVGCGGGILSESLAAQGANVTGIDVAEKALSVARLHLHESGQQVNYQQSTAEDWAGKHPSSASVVTCMEMLEHVPSPSSVVTACAEMLMPGGNLFMSTLNRNPLSFAVAIVGAEYVARIVPQGTHQYGRFIKPSELCNWLRSAGLKVMDISGVHYNPLERTARIGGHVRVNYIIHAVKPDQRT
jgi:2-polyprenyl-6-hydroxyphenyl methylase/3-demethylubiquinone-9 3-methyltransferase